jgi:asparagine synthase (glutamine-hydrolysing)
LKARAMCGICGRLNFDRHQPVDAQLVRAMMDRLQHRGPDGAGAYVSGPIGLGHRRLSIIDLAGGRQPMANEDGAIQLVYNGEIYNYRELRAELLEAGHCFRSGSDTEVIVHLYEEMGAACVERLQGMFAFALWDQRRQRLLLARDRVGIKPLYWADTGRAIVFGSEIKALLVDPDVAADISPRSIDSLLTHYYLPGRRTMFERIHKLEPGHTLSVTDGRIRLRRYWSLCFDKPAHPPSFETSVENLRDLLTRSVADHMASDVPVGVLLSGGVDSTGVLSRAARHADQPLHSFTVGFAGADGVPDERPYARLAAQRYGTVHHDTTLAAGDFLELLPLLARHMDEPICEPPAVALYAVTRLAREASVKVLLSGEGGDEAFAGYQDYRNLLLLERLKSAFGPFKGGLRAGLRALAHAGWARGAHYADLVDLPASRYYLSHSAAPTTPFNRLKPLLYRDMAAMTGADHHMRTPTRELWQQCGGGDLLDHMLHVDTLTWLPDDLLIKADRMSMAASVELRVPLLDTRILEFAAALPSHYKLAGWQTKRILKAALAPDLPRQILERPKAGLPVPYARWLRSELHDWVHDTLLASRTCIGHYVARPALARLLLSFDHGADCAKEVYTLLTLELWLRELRQGAHAPATYPAGQGPHRHASGGYGIDPTPGATRETELSPASAHTASGARSAPALALPT